MTIPRRSAVLLACLLAACAGGDEPADSPQAADSAQAARPATTAPAPDSAIPAAPATAPTLATPRDTMLTQWTTLEMPSEPWVQENASPEALLRQVRDVVAAQLEEPDAGVLPTRMESQAADSAVGHLTHPDLADDSIRDIEFRIHMRRDGSIWRVTSGRPPRALPPWRGRWRTVRVRVRMSITEPEDRQEQQTQPWHSTKFLGFPRDVGKRVRTDGGFGALEFSAFQGLV